ncbi:MAG: hypothetical protein RIF41_33005, partial [Polyangiaceae bacterium]
MMRSRRWLGIVILVSAGCDDAKTTDVVAEGPVRTASAVPTGSGSVANPGGARPAGGERFVRPPPIGAPGMGDAVDACTQVGGFYLSCQSAYLGEGDPVMKRYLRRIAEGHGAGQKGYAHGGKAIAEGSIAHAEIPFQCQPDKPCGAESEYGRLNDPTSCLARAHEASLMKDPKAAEAAHRHACRCAPKEGTFIGYNHTAFICQGKTPAFIAPNMAEEVGRDVADCAMCHPTRGPQACRREIAR